jgi:serine/threonine-protein kinase
MGEVWAASGDHQGAHREVAIKVLLARAAMKPDIVRRFEREARIASAIDSPFVCQLIELVEGAEGQPLLVFEQLTGESLADRLKREQYLPLSEVGPIIDDVLQGLSAAHAAGVIHRDLKPGNIFLEQFPEAPANGYAPPSGGFGFGAAPPAVRRERAKILDFGISKLTRSQKEEPTLTAFDATLGSFAYMAPEQVRGAARADERADIYAIGAVAFRALSGRLPFEGATAAVLVAMKLDREAPSLAEATGEQWPAGVERFLERALARRREARFESADEALAVWRSIQPSAVVAPRPSPPRASLPSVSSVSPLIHSGAPLPMRAERIPAPTKPIIGPGGKGRHGTLTMDELPIPSLLPTDEPRSPTTTNRIVINRATGKPEPVVPPKPIARPPMQSYQIIDDNPTELDGPPEMTVDGSADPAPTDDPRPGPPRPSKKGKSGRS